VYRYCYCYLYCIVYMVKCVKYWTQLLYMKPTRYPRASYTLLYELYQGAEHIVKHILYLHGFGIVWLCQDVGCPVTFVNQYKQRMCDHYVQKWCHEKGASPKLTYYEIFKTMLEPEKYMSCIHNREHRVALT
jgi:hypothetical protein